MCVCERECGVWWCERESASVYEVCVRERVCVSVCVFS